MLNIFWQLAYVNNPSLMTTGKLLNAIVSIGRSVGQTTDLHLPWFSIGAKVLGLNKHFTDIVAYSHGLMLISFTNA
jgi:hypothetical protein